MQFLSAVASLAGGRPAMTWWKSISC